MAAGCAAGEPQVFEQMYRALGDRMKSIAYQHLGNTTDAEDAVQETFLKVHRSAGSYTGDAAFSTWVFRVLINTCYDHLRKRRRRPEEAPLDDAVEIAGKTAPHVDDAKRLTLRKMLGELPEQRRTVFTLFEIEGLSHAEIGQMLGISEGNSKWILFTTKKELQQQWRSKR